MGIKCADKINMSRSFKNQTINSILFKLAEFQEELYIKLFKTFVLYLNTFFNVAPIFVQNMIEWIIKLSKASLNKT